MHPSKFREMGIGSGDTTPSPPSSLNPIQSAYKTPNNCSKKIPSLEALPVVDERAEAEEWRAGGLGGYEETGVVRPCRRGLQMISSGISRISSWLENICRPRTRIDRCSPMNKI